MTHEIELEGYYPKILGSPMRMLCLGTKASYGMEVLHFQRGTGRDRLLCDVPVTEDENDNLCMRAAKVFFAETGLKSDGVTVTLEKRIPMQAGLGGGSSAARRHSAGNQQRQRYGARRAGWRAVHQLQHPIPGAEPRPGARPADRPGGKCVETVCR